MNTAENLTYPLRPAERRILKKRDKLPPSLWSEGVPGKHKPQRYIRRGAKSGPWQNRNNPVGALIMDLFALAHVRVGVVGKGSQTGISDAVYSFLGREIDYSTGSDAALVVLADEKSVKKHSKNRIARMLEDSPSLSEIISSNPDDSSIYSYKLTTGASIEIGWATSQVSLASDAYRWVLLDEIGKYKNVVNIKEAEVRTATYEKFGKKVIKYGAPTDDGCPVDTALEECDVIYDVHVPCPECGSFQPMVFEQFRYPGQQTIEGNVEGDPRRIRRERLATYECAHCQHNWTDYERDQALQHAELRPRHDDIEYPYAVGVHVPAWVTPFRSLSDCVAEWLEAQDKHESLQAWYNNWAGLSFGGITEEELTATDVLYARRHQWWPDGAEWQVPQEACILIAAVDQQDNRLEIKVNAYGPGYESWRIDLHIIPGSPSEPAVWQMLDEYLEREWLHESGHRIKIAAAGVDTGGHHTQEAYKYLKKRLTRRIYGIKGASDAYAPLVRWSQPSKKQRRQIPLLLINTVIAKNDIFARMKNEEHGPGFMHLGLDMDYERVKQLTSEKPVDQRDKYGRKKRFWVKKAGNVRNEELDLEVYPYAVLCYLNPNWEALAAKLMPVVEAEAELDEEQSHKKKRRRPRKRGASLSSRIQGGI